MGFLHAHFPCGEVGLDKSIAKDAVSESFECSLRMVAEIVGSLAS